MFKERLLTSAGGKGILMQVLLDQNLTSALLQAEFFEPL